ncbi:AHH domain-containing protein [Massilia genomosp. 1]|nr:AHH domain-containing protein [Massilia genomosp. 1]
MYAYAPNPTGWMDPLGWCSTALGRNIGAKPGDGMQNHHLIPEEIMGDFNYSAMFDRLRSLGFKDDGAPNGILLPGSSALAKTMNLPGHWSNHNQYTAAIKNEVSILSDRFDAGLIGNNELKEGIGEIQKWAREELIKGTFVVDVITGRLL